MAIESLLATKAGASPEFAAAIDALIASLLDAARLLAEHHLALARSACGPCDAPTGTPRKVCEAEALLASGDSARSAGNPSLAAHWYGMAVERAGVALNRCD